MSDDYRNIKFNTLNCKECCELSNNPSAQHAICCYDGVYLKNDEEDKINKFVKDNPTFFRELPEKFIVDGNWRDIIKGRKTAVKEYVHNHPLFPKHFNNTTCVFNDCNGRCMLQKAAEELRLRDWEVKPLSCILFPLRLENGNLLPPPSKYEKDPCYIDESYPAFYKSLPCGMEHEDGIAWEDTFKDEITFFNAYLKSIK